MNKTEMMAQDGSDSSGNTDTDVIVLGVGTCGEDLSLRLLGAGLKVVGIEAALVGGECPYWACLPSKMMIRAANILQESRRIQDRAGQATVTPDWGPVAERIRTEASGGWDDSLAVKRFEDRGGFLVHGCGRLTGPKTITVGDRIFTAGHGVVISTGSKTVIPQIPGLREIDYWTTHDVISAENLPDSIIIIGGGAIGCEIGQVLARFGVQVTIIEDGGRLLPAEESEASEVVAAAFAAERIQVHTNTKVERVDSVDNLIVVMLAGDIELSAERLLVATGRTVDLTGLGLESVGLDNRKPFLTVDEQMRAAEGIWAMGDVTGKGMFTHVALYQSAIVAADILGEEHPPAKYDAIPRVTFTDPEVGAVGITETQAATAGLDVVVTVKQLGSTFRGWLHGSGSGIIKLIAERKTGILVGATSVGPHGGEMLGLLSLAVHSRLPLEELRSMIYAFPTFYGAIGESIGAYGRGLATVLDPTYNGVEILQTIYQGDRESKINVGNKR